MLNTAMEGPVSKSQQHGVSRVERFRKELGPFVVAAETTRMPMIFTDGRDADNPIVFANDAFLALTGFTPDAILGTPLNHVLGDVTDSTTVSSICLALEKRGSSSWEMQCRRADKSEFLAAVFLSPVRDKNGVVQQNFLSFVELGGHVERLLDQRNELHALYELAPGFIAATDGPEHRFTFANASYKKFVGRDDLVGKTVAEVLPEIGDQGFLRLLDDVYRTGKPFVGRTMPMGIVNPSSGLVEIRYCDFVYQAVRNARDAITGLFCEGYDVSEQRETADTLAALQSELIHVARVNAMGTMATTLAHELNQPLSAIANYAVGARRLMDAVSEQDARLGDALQGIEEASQRAADIIRNLRELTRRREPARVAFDLKVAIGECIRLVQATAPPGINIVDTSSDDIMIAADRIQIQQVVINLLRNACDAASGVDRPYVSINATMRDQDVLVSVVDMGQGVPLEAARNIFSWSDSSKEGGMGLGLSICQTIMEAHRGRIWLERSGRDGSEFCFSLPGMVPSTSASHATG